MQAFNKKSQKTAQEVGFLALICCSQQCALDMVLCSMSETHGSDHDQGREEFWLATQYRQQVTGQTNPMLQGKCKH